MDLVMRSADSKFLVVSGHGADLRWKTYRATTVWAQLRGYVCGLSTKLQAQYEAVVNLRAEISVSTGRCCLYKFVAKSRQTTATEEMHKRQTEGELPTHGAL